MSTAPDAPRGRRVVVMGVAGGGKSTVGGLLAERLGGAYVEGDELHPRANIDKMAAGVPLDDADRAPWLRLVGERLAAAGGRGETVALGCSALKRSYRDLIRAAAPDTLFVHLHGSRELLAERMADRPGHFMPAALLDSQLETLEPLGDDEAGAVFDIADAPEDIAAAAAEWVSAQ